MGMKGTLIIAATIIACTIGIIIAITVQSNAIAEQNWQRCIADQGGYQSTNIDDSIAIADACSGYLR